MNLYYILKGHKPVLCEDVSAWAKWFGTADRHVGKTEIPELAILVWLGRLFKTKRFEPVRVSTVFLGLDHSFEEDMPILFETMIFGGKFDEEMWRYSTWEDAEKGHEKAVEKVKNSK